MRCVCCGKALDKGTQTCVRCGADLTPRKRIHAILITVAYAAISIAIVALIIHMVLYWHESQILIKL